MNPNLPNVTIYYQSGAMTRPLKTHLEDPCSRIQAIRAVAQETRQAEDDVQIKRVYPLEVKDDR